MDGQIKEKEFLLVDKEDFWRESAYASLSSRGCRVKRYRSYEDLRTVLGGGEKKPHLVIVGCSKPSIKEIRLIRFLRANNFRQLVLCSFLSANDMKVLFLAGADDVTKKPFSALRLTTTVRESLDNIACRESIDRCVYENFNDPFAGNS